MRYILIDNNSGFIFGDSADFAAGRQSDIDGPVDAARMLDESIGVHGRRYVLHDHASAFATGYHVYYADIDGSEAVPVVQDGQDQDTIDEVERRCDYVGFVEAIDAR